MQRTLPIFLAVIFSFQFSAAQKSNQQTNLSISDFLREYYDFGSLPAYKINAYCAETSTYDRTGGNNDGFEGTYSFIRRNADSSLVIFDVKGTGVVNRIWTPTPTDDSLDFYIDDSTKIAFTIFYRDLFSGKVYPFVAPLCSNQLGGYYCYLPIPFNKSCKIVSRGKTERFHQIGYRLYPKGTKIDKFVLPLGKDAQGDLSLIKLKWGKSFLSEKDFGQDGLAVSTINKNFELRANESVTVFQTDQAGRILGFDFSSDGGLEKNAKNIDLKITWDDESSPAIYCPLADYFGYAFGKPSMKSILIGSEGGKNYSYFPMPFDKSAKIELIFRATDNETKKTVINFQGNVYVSSKKRDIEKEGKFYAYWKRNNPVPTGEPHVMLDIKGKGHFVGTVLQAQGLKAGMTSFFEGDDSTVVDGELRMHGTGSEDFFNGGWYALLDRWDGAMSLPLSGALEYSLPLCRTGGYRFFLGDKISFEKKFFQSIEHGPEYNLVPADYTSVSYYYCSVPNVQTVMPTAQNTKLNVLDTLFIYPQLMSAAFDGDVNVETKWAYPTGGMSFFYTVKENTNMRISLNEIPSGDYRLYLDYIKSSKACEFSVWQRQSQLTDWMQPSQEKEERVEMQEITDVTITPINKTISLHFKPKENQDQFILNRIILVKK